MNRVLEATLTGSLGSLGNAAYKLIRQVRFPDTYDDLDTITGADHDRIRMWDSKHHDRCVKEHTGWGDMGIGDWAEKATQSQLMAFCQDMLKADATVKWTGCRILGTVNRSNGYAVWTIELFAKHPKSKTKVYSEMNAPNVKSVYGERIEMMDGHFQIWSKY